MNEELKIINKKIEKLIIFLFNKIINKKMKFCFKDALCYHCHKNVLSDEINIRCVRCNIKLHKTCYDVSEQSKYYTQCPNCHKIGTMGILLEDLNYLSHIEGGKKCSDLYKKKSKKKM